MTPEREKELFARIDRLTDGMGKLVDVVTTQSSLIGSLQGQMNSLQGQMSTLEHKFEALHEVVADMRGDFKAVNARLDEQRATLNALIPTRLAAVPSAA